MIAEILLGICYVGMGVSLLGIFYHCNKIQIAQREIRRLNKLQGKIRDLQIRILIDEYNRQVIALKEKLGDF
jgi:t-SNARE complex subunit (syntaxin)